MKTLCHVCDTLSHAAVMLSWKSPVPFVRGVTDYVTPKINFGVSGERQGNTDPSVLPGTSHTVLC